MNTFKLPWTDPIQKDSLRILVNRLRQAAKDPVFNHLYKIADDLTELLNSQERLKAQVEELKPKLSPSILAKTAGVLAQRAIDARGSDARLALEEAFIQFMTENEDRMDSLLYDSWTLENTPENSGSDLVDFFIERVSSPDHWI